MVLKFRIRENGRYIHSKTCYVSFFKQKSINFDVAQVLLTLFLCVYVHARICAHTETSGHAVSKADAGAQFPLP